MIVEYTYENLGGFMNVKKKLNRHGNTPRVKSKAKKKNSGTPSRKLIRNMPGH
jgi:hypothetical protein